jgi:hypothetical protein
MGTAERWIRPFFGRGHVETTRRAGNSQWIEHVRIPPLGKDATFLIFWDPARTVARNRWRATYEDVAGSSYTSECVTDRNTIYDKFLPPKFDEEVIERWWKRPQGGGH